VELAAGRPGELGDPALDRGVDVLVGLGANTKLPAASSILDLVERGQHGGASSRRADPPRASPRTWAREPAMSSGARRWS
jgi:hypothetical protein